MQVTIGERKDDIRIEGIVLESVHGHRILPSKPIADGTKGRICDRNVRSIDRHERPPNLVAINGRDIVLNTLYARNRIVKFVRIHRIALRKYELQDGGLWQLMPEQQCVDILEGGNATITQDVFSSKVHPHD